MTEEQLIRIKNAAKELMKVLNEANVELDISVEEYYKQFCLDMLDAIEKWEKGEDIPNWFTETCGLCYNVNSWETRSDNTALRLYYFQKELFNGDISPFNDEFGGLSYEVERELNIIYKNEARLAWLRKYAGKEC